MANTKTVAIGEGFWELAKSLALRERVSVRAVVESALKSYAAGVVVGAEPLAAYRATTSGDYDRLAALREIVGKMSQLSDGPSRVLGVTVRDLKYDPEDA